jgi:hypothetical protein
MENKIVEKTKSDFYKTLTSYTACSIAAGFCEGEDATDDQRRDAWQWLHDTGLGYRLQGWYGRTLRDLIESGEVTE